MSRFTIDGGGAMHSGGGNFVLSGTIGQLDAGTMSGGDLQLTGGFWFETPPGDCNENGTVGFMDFDAFLNCLTGQAGATMVHLMGHGWTGSWEYDGAQLSLIYLSAA